MKSLDRVFALIDINSCYVEFECFFKPYLRGKAVLVLSNNDANVISRSAEAKAIGIPMGVPYFKIKDIVKQHNVYVFSSNYPLYADLSRRFMNIVGQFVAAEDRHVYSIDEVFLDLSSYRDLFDLNQYAHEILATVKKCLNLTCCVGLGRSKTEAKLANHFAKQNKHFNGVCNLINMDPCSTEGMYASTDVREIWGVGRKHAQKLNGLGIYTALDLTLSDPKLIGQQFSVVLKRTVLELNGLSCLDIQDAPANRNQIVSSRSFGHKISDINEIKEATAYFTTLAVHRLRKQGLLCRMVGVYIQTSRFSEGEKHNPYVIVQLNEHSSDILTINRAVAHAINSIFKSGIDYKRAGVILMEIIPYESFKPDLFTDHHKRDQRENLATTIDCISARYGRHSVSLGLSGFKDRKWSMTQSMRSQNYLSDWRELLLVN